MSQQAARRGHAGLKWTASRAGTGRGQAVRCAAQKGVAGAGAGGCLQWNSDNHSIPPLHIPEPSTKPSACLPGPSCHNKRAAGQSRRADVQAPHGGGGWLNCRQARPLLPTMSNSYARAAAGSSTATASSSAARCSEPIAAASCLSGGWALWAVHSLQLRSSTKCETLKLAIDARRGPGSWTASPALRRACRQAKARNE